MSILIYLIKCNFVGDRVNDGLNKKGHAMMVKAKYYLWLWYNYAVSKLMLNYKTDADFE